jgi:hypothetical protein
MMSCTTKDGITISSEVGTGSILVSSSVNNARVFLDYRDTGKNTPVILNDVAMGTHVIHLFLSGYRADQDSIRVTVTEGEESNASFILNETPAVGDLKVTTTPPGALVRLDRLPFGRTPLAVSGILEGDHRVEVIKGGYKGVVENIKINTNQTVDLQPALILKPQLTLVEHFSNTDCAPCPEADIIIEEVLTERGVDSTTVISFHPDFPGPSDPFFLSAEPENLYRHRYYSSRPLPYVNVDGIFEMAGTFELRNRFVNALTQRSGLSPVATLDFFNVEESVQAVNEISGQVEVRVIEDLPSDNIWLRIALIEHEISFPAPPGTNGQMHFFDVMRALLPFTAAPNPKDSEFGYPVNLAKGESALFDFRFEFQSEWAANEMQVVVFLQNEDTKEVLQSLWTLQK